MAASKALRTGVYIDGYNLYYGCLKGSPYKWLDPLVLIEQHIIPTSMPPDMHAVLLPLFINTLPSRLSSERPRPKTRFSRRHVTTRHCRKLYGGQIELIEGYYSIVESKAKIVDEGRPGFV